MNKIVKNLIIHNNDDIYDDERICISHCIHRVHRKGLWKCNKLPLMQIKVDL